jgi:hypothetical protein
MARLQQAQRVEPYRPSNGTDGECFMGQWCAGCDRDSYPDWDDGDSDEKRCEILGLGLCGEQPPEWIQDERGPRCTAFVDDGSPIFDPRAAIRLLL